MVNFFPFIFLADVQSLCFATLIHIKNYYGKGGLIPQSRQSTKLFLKSSELGLPQPLTRRRVCPPWFRGRGTLERGSGSLGESLFRREDIHCGTL
jgi:hypothetical protein